VYRVHGTGRVHYIAGRDEWAAMLERLADDYEQYGRVPLRDVAWQCRDDLIDATVRWMWWHKDEYQSPPKLLVQRNTKGERIHLSTNYPHGTSIVLREGATLVRQALPTAIRLAQHPDTAWWVLTLDYESGMMPAVTTGLIEG
jgi:hypothetical protein